MCHSTCSRKKTTSSCLRSDRKAGFARPGAAPEDVKRVVDMILAAERPAFFVSHGVTLAEAGPALTRVAELLDIPAITSPNGMGSVPMVLHAIDNTGMVDLRFIVVTSPPDE